MNKYNDVVIFLMRINTPHTMLLKHKMRQLVAYRCETCIFWINLDFYRKKRVNNNASYFCVNELQRKAAFIFNKNKEKRIRFR